MKVVNTSVIKKDAMALVTGKPVYTDDIAPSDCLVIKLLRSPYAHALIEDINIDIAKKYRELSVSLHIKMYQIKDLLWLVKLIQSQVHMIDLFLIKD